METLETLGGVVAVIVPVLSGLVWVVRRIERGQTRVFRKINRIDKHKVSYKVCDQRRAQCPCRKKEGKAR